jgi:hypothetical protein
MSLPDLLPHTTLGQFLGMTELVEKGLVNPTVFTSRCIEIAKEYKKSKEAQQ